MRASKRWENEVKGPVRLHGIPPLERPLVWVRLVRAGTGEVERRRALVHGWGRDPDVAQLWIDGYSVVVPASDVTRISEEEAQRLLDERHRPDELDDGGSAGRVT